MQDITVVNLNEAQFLEVAKYYDWDKFQKESLARRTHKIYFRDNKPSGWDDNSTIRHHTENKEVSFVEWIQLTNPKPTKVESKMKYVVEVNNQAEADAVAKQNNQSARKFNEFPKHVTNTGSWNDADDFHSTPVAIDDWGPLLSFKQFAAMFDIKLKPNKTLKLTSDYTAQVNYSTKIVQVGCQSIPFSVVEELAKLIKE